MKEKKARYAFNGITYTALAGFTLLGGAYGYWSYHSTDSGEYQKLIARSNPVNSATQVAPYQAKQERADVQKELVFTRDHSRLVVRIVSEKAEMILDHTDTSNELVEAMHPVKIYMQEELFYLLPDGTKVATLDDAKEQTNAKQMQIIRYVEADQARYYYHADRLDASKVKMARYTAPGHVLVTDLGALTPSIEGEASSIQLNPKDDALNLQAHQLQATLTDNKTILRSNNGSWKNGELTLLGDVSLDNELGRLLTQSATLSSDKHNHHEFDDIVHLTEGVNLLLKNGNTLTADHATIDYKDYVGNFFGGKLYPKVIYNEQIGDHGADLSVDSKRMQARFSPDASTDHSSTHVHIHEIKAEEDVTIKYKTDFTASSERLIWEAKNDTITLQERVVFFQEGMGELSAEEELKIVRGKVNGKSELQSIQTRGKSILVRNLERQTITCLGDVFVDHDQKSITLTSPKDSSGTISEQDQVHFKDPSGDIYADRVVIHYSLAQNHPAADKVVLEGQVRILNQPIASTEGEPQPVQYALADHVELLLNHNEMILSAIPEKRVLFYDKSRDLQISAPLLKIARNQETKKDSIKGSGDVRFNFVEKEFEALRRTFSFKQQEKSS